jgi:hypothetical protein
MSENPRWVNNLIMYYGCLQSLHLLVLIRAGALLLFEGRYPFPVLPPPGGWDNQMLPFFIGLGITDSVGILLGIVFAGQSIFKVRLNRRLGVISLTIFISGAIVFGIGTVFSTAWAAHPFAYGLMAVLFLPVPVLYTWLLRSNLTPRSASSKAH